MSAGMLFLIMLIIGVLLVFLGSKVENKTKVILIIIGVVIACVGAFGIFTSLI